VRFTDFLKAAVLMCGGAATLLAVVTVLVAERDDDPSVVFIGAAWWFLAAMYGAFLGRRSETNPSIAKLLADARWQTSLPEVHPARALLNRLWPLVLITLVSGGLAFVAPQVAAIACGFAIVAALAWRRQEAAVTAIEGRDGVRFYLERTSPVAPIKLVRTPGFRTARPPVEHQPPPLN
jgi:hypothetical protein